MDIFELCSPTDHRRDRALRRETYVTPLGPAAARAIDAAWQDLTAGAPETPLTLTVQGRVQVFGRSLGRALRCEFAELCERPLGAADYLALAGAVDLLVIENIPRLDPRQSDVAWRFVTLIDALYEARVRLILSAEVGADDLYPEGEGAFEFARTASRLQEMRSADWWRG